MPKILIIDIETSPAVAYIWKFFKENISPKQVIKHPHIMSYAAKWLGEGEIFYEESRTPNDKTLLQKLAYLLDQADIVVAHNGLGFDLPRIKSRLLVHGIKPPSPVKVIDTLKVARAEFGFSGNSLEYLSEVLDLRTQKGNHSKFAGFTLWSECLKGNEEAWAAMKDYNVKDIIVLEELYLRLRPYDTKHPNLAVYSEPSEDPVCPKCGGKHLQYRGYAYTSVGKFHRMQCTTCGGWSRTRYSLRGKDENLVVNQVN
jgi:DNA polymerase elongation subunit (family B)